MTLRTLLVLGLALFCGCTPSTNERSPAPDAHQPSSTSAIAGDAADGTQAEPHAQGVASYEVAIASAEADRVRAAELCDSKSRAERSACHAAAEAAYTKARSEADSARPGT